MKLYYSPVACSLAPHIVMHEAGLAYTPVLASTKSKKLQDGTDYYSINPLGDVPLLELDNGERLREGMVIMQYLADQAPEKKLAPPPASMERYRLQEWLCFIATELHKGFNPLFNPNTPEEVKTMVREQLLKRYAWVEEQLAGKPYVMGDQFTVADAYLFTVSNWGQFVGVDLSGFQNLSAVRDRIAARPGVQAAMKAEGLLN